MTIEDNIARLREAPHGYVLVKAYSGCGAYADDAPGLRIQCQTKLRVGAPCEKCPQGESPKVIAAILAAWDEREAMRKDAERYRWLRAGERTRQGIPVPGGHRHIPRDPLRVLMEFSYWCAPSELDAAIDAAMQERQA